MNRFEVKKSKREAAASRQAEWDSLSTVEKIIDLDRRLGKGVGAVKQRKRLALKLEAEREAEQAAALPVKKKVKKS